MATASPASTTVRFPTYKIYQNDANTLGFGTYGKVYKGLHIPTKQTIAAKFVQIERENVDEEKDLHELHEIHEARFLMNRVTPHDNIIRVRDILTKEWIRSSDGCDIVDFYIIMDYADESDLRKFPLRHSLDINSKIDIMLQIGRGISHLHGHNPPIAHRDLKPANVLVCSGTPVVVKVADFGFATVVEGSRGNTVAFKTHTGTPGYLAPEQIVRMGSTVAVSYDKTVDIFALGVVYLAILQSKKGKRMDPVKGK